MMFAQIKTHFKWTWCDEVMMAAIFGVILLIVNRQFFKNARCRVQNRPYSEEPILWLAFVKTDAENGGKGKIISSFIHVSLYAPSL
jgi:hypothetical protein